MNKRALKVEGQKWMLQESNVMYQEINLPDDETAALEQLLALSGWHKEEVFKENFKTPDQIRELGMLMDKGAIMWTTVNGQKWLKVTDLGKDLIKALKKEIGIVARVKVWAGNRKFTGGGHVPKVKTKDE